MPDSYLDKIAEAAAILNSSSWLTAFTGAGISTESGISDFRSPGGVWDRYQVVTYQEFIQSSEARCRYWAMKRELFKEMSGAKPNKAHLALARLQQMGKLKCLITQNIDGLHSDAGNTEDIICELHGTNRKATCLSCNDITPIEQVQKRLDEGDKEPHCLKCDGMLKPATVWFTMGK